jgi:hypothetical protein
MPLLVLATHEIRCVGKSSRNCPIKNAWKNGRVAILLLCPVHHEKHNPQPIQVFKFSLLNNVFHIRTYIHTYHSRFIPEGAAEASQTLLRDTHALPELVSFE